MPDPTRFLTLDEALHVLADLHRNKKTGRNSHLNLMVFRFACCCGLRRSEMVGLRFNDLVLSGSRPCVMIRKDNTKGQWHKRKSRKVPLWWDKGTLDDIIEWVEFRKTMDVEPHDPVLCGISKVNYGKPLTGDMAARHWKTAIRCLGDERVKQLSIHCGRHSFCSLSLMAGHSTIAIRDAAGHSCIENTNIYLHAMESDKVQDIFTHQF